MITELMLILGLLLGGVAEGGKPDPGQEIVVNGLGGCPGGVCDKEDD